MGKFGKFFAYLQFGLGTVGTVLQTEQAVQQPKSGPAKLAIVVNTVATAAAATPEIAQHINQKDAEATATSIANTTVAILKTAGIFQSK